MFFVIANGSGLRLATGHNHYSTLPRCAGDRSGQSEQTTGPADRAPARQRAAALSRCGLKRVLNKNRRSLVESGGRCMSLLTSPLLPLSIRRSMVRSNALDPASAAKTRHQRHRLAGRAVLPSAPLADWLYTMTSMVSSSATNHSDRKI